MVDHISKDSLKRRFPVNLDDKGAVRSSDILEILQHPNICTLNNTKSLGHFGLLFMILKEQFSTCSANFI